MFRRRASLQMRQLRYFACCAFRKIGGFTKKDIIVKNGNLTSTQRKVPGHLLTEKTFTLSFRPVFLSSCHHVSL